MKSQFTGYSESFVYFVNTIEELLNTLHMTPLSHWRTYFSFFFLSKVSKSAGKWFKRGKFVKGGGSIFCLTPFTTKNCKFCKSLNLNTVHHSTSQCAEGILNKIAKPLNETFTGLMCMLQGFRMIFVWNPRLKGIESTY